MAKRRKAKRGRGAAAVTSEAEAILRRLVDDSHLREAVGGLLDAVAPAASEPRKGRRKKVRFGVGKLMLVGGLAGGGAIAASKGLRAKVLDLLFGAEEEFEYAPPTPAPSEGEASNTPLSAV